MVLLTMTPGIVRVLSRFEAVLPTEFGNLQLPPAPTLANPTPGNPISHAQLIALSKLLPRLTDAPQADDPSSSSPVPTTLAALLHATTLYTPPPPPKPAQTPEYHALMSRLRADQERITYERMLNPPPTRESFSQRFPHARSQIQTEFTIGVDEVDDVSYEEVHRQIILIINVLISIVCVAVFVWVAARHWSVGLRLGLAMGSAFGVGVAEVGVYSGYVRKVREAKRVEMKKPEVREIVASWVLDKEGEAVVTSKEKDDGVRYRKGKHR